MKYVVDEWNNFCRVFELPKTYPNSYCFGGGHSVDFQMVDWFNPIPGLDHQSGITKEDFIIDGGKIETIFVSIDELRDFILPWIKKKSYVRRERNYLILCDFGACLQFSG